MISYSSIAKKPDMPSVNTNTNTNPNPDTNTNTNPDTNTNTNPDTNTNINTGNSSYSKKEKNNYEEKKKINGRNFILEEEKKSSSQNKKYQKKNVNKIIIPRKKSIYCKKAINKWLYIKIENNYFHYDYCLKLFELLLRWVRINHFNITVSENVLLAKFISLMYLFSNKQNYIS